MCGIMQNMRYHKCRFVQCSVGFTIGECGNVLENGAIEEHQVWIPSVPEVPYGLETSACGRRDREGSGRLRTERATLFMSLLHPG